MVGPPKSTEAFELDEQEIEQVQDSESKLGRYTLRWQIASGGMATVYLGRLEGPLGIERAVAIKRIHPHLAKRKHFVEMFLDEARIASRINHPNVCTVLDFGEVAGVYFMAMEYLVGEPLQRLFHEVSREGELLTSPAWHAFAARIVADAAAGLHAAHELRDEAGRPLEVVHRDVSPQNVFVTFDGAVKLVDFGVARAHDRLHRTTTGTLKGKLAYMAPEHAGGEEIDRRADVWSLGVCLWEGLAGRRLFRRRNEMDTLLAVRAGPIPVPSAVNPSVPAALDAICMRALDRDPDRRYPTARELGRDLEAFVRQSGQPTGLADLAEFVEPLLRRQRSQKHQLLATVLQPELHAAETVTLTPPESSGVRDTVVTPTPEAPKEAEPTPAGPTAPRPEVDALTPYPLREPPRRSRRGALLAALGAVAGAALVWLAWPSDETEELRSNEPSESGTALANAPPSEPTAPRSEPEQPAQPEMVPAAVTDTETAPDTETETGAEVEPESATETASDTDTAAETERAVEPQPRPSPRRPRRAAAAHRAAGHGTLNVVAIGGWAEIEVDGRPVGRTPLSTRVPAGRHVVSARPFGDGPEKRMAVRVERDEVERVRIRMD